jgi:hypothetical protein
MVAAQSRLQCGARADFIFHSRKIWWHAKTSVPVEPSLTAMSSVPFDPRQEGLVKELAALTGGLAEFREALHPINDDRLRTAFREVLDNAERIVASHARRPGTLIADDITSLRSLFVRHDIPREDPDLGKVPSLTALRSARGSILADFDSVLAAAKSLGKVPNNPDVRLPTGAELERAGREGQLVALEHRLRKVENVLQTKIAPESQFDEDHSPQQIGLVNFYVNAMKIELTLATLETRARDLIDLAGLTRAVEAIGELTTDFVSTVRGLRDKVTESLENAALAIRPTVRRVAVGLKTIVSWVRRHARRSAEHVKTHELVAESLGVRPLKARSPNVYIEARPKARPEGDPIDDYVVEDHADHVLATFKTQREAIDWAKKNGHAPHVARVRHLNDKKKPDHWRAA